MKLACWGYWSSPFTYTESAHSVKNLLRPERAEVKFFRGKGWCAARGHNDALEQSLAWGADVLLTVGHDQVYDEDFIVRMLQRFREVGSRGMVHALVPFRGTGIENANMKPYQPPCWRVDGDLMTWKGMHREPHRVHAVTPADGPFVRCHMLGSGAMMFSRTLIESMKKPWFWEVIEKERFNTPHNGDVEFTVRAQRETKEIMWVDTTINIRHSNVGNIEYDWGGHDK